MSLSYVIPEYNSTHALFGRILKLFTNLQLQLSIVQNTFSELGRQSFESKLNQDICEENQMQSQTYKFPPNERRSGSPVKSTSSTTPFLFDPESSLNSDVKDHVEFSKCPGHQKLTDGSRCKWICQFLVAPLQVLISVLLVLVLLGILVKCGAVSWLMYDASSSSKMASFFGCPSKPRFTSHKTLRISSYVDYQRHMSKIDRSTAVNLYVKTSDPDEWLYDASLEKADQVTNLTIVTWPESKLTLSLLRKMTNIEHIHILHQNALDLDFNYGKSEVDLTTPLAGAISLQSLESLQFTRVNASSEYENIARYIIAHSLKRIVVHSSHLSPISKEYLKQIIFRSAKSLEYVELNETALPSGVFSPLEKSFPRLREVKIDVIPTGMITDRFISAYPNIQVFHAENSRIEWNELLILVHSPSIKDISVGVQFRYNIAHAENFFAEHRYPQITGTLIVHYTDDKRVCSLRAAIKRALAGVQVFTKVRCDDNL